MLSNLPYAGDSYTSCQEILRFSWSPKFGLSWVSSIRL